MADHDHDDYDDHDRGHSSHGSSSHDYDKSSSHSGEREKFGNTSSFNTMLSEDGRFFGVKLDPQTAQKFREFYPTALIYMRKYGEDFVTHHTDDKWGNIAGWTIALGEQIYQTGQNIYDSVRSANDLRVAVQPLAKSADHGKNTAALSGSNEVVANARAKISGVFYQKMLETVLGSVGAFPTILDKVHHAKESKKKAAIKKARIEAGTDPQKLAELQRKELSGTLTEHGQKASGEITAEQRRIGRMKLLEEEEALYFKKFEEFKAKNKIEIEKEIKEALKIDLSNYTFQMKRLNDYGIDTSELSHALTQSHYYNGKDRKEMSDGGVDYLLKQFTEGLTKKGSLTRVTEEALKTKFAKTEGAWDGTWKPKRDRDDYNYSSRDRDSHEPLTKKEQWEQDFKKIDEDNRKLEQAAHTPNKGHDSDKAAKNTLDVGSGLLAGFGREVLTKAFVGKSMEQLSQPLALDRILNLRRTMEKAGDNPPDEVPAVAQKENAPNREKDMGYVQYVHEIFQRHQKDCHRPEIGERYTEHFEKAKWNDKDIQEMTEDKLNPYEFAVKAIAKRIKDGRMDAIALVDLVGDKYKKIVGNDGRTFGPQGSGKDEKIVKAAIKKLIDEKTATLHAAQEQTEEQINNKLGDLIFSVEDMKNALESKTLPQQERAFIFTVFSDVVGSDEKLCEKIGIKSERCQELRKECKETFSSLLDGAVAVLAEMIEKQPEVLEKHLKLTDKEKELIQSLAARSKEDGKVVPDAVDNRDELKTIETVVANAAMTLGKAPPITDENGKPQSFWQRMVAATKKPKKKPEEQGKEEGSRKRDKDAHDDDRPFDDNPSKKRKKLADGESFEDRSEKKDRDSDVRDSDDMDEEFGKKSRSFESSRGRHKPGDSDRLSSYADRVRGGKDKEDRVIT